MLARGGLHAALQEEKRELPMVSSDVWLEIESVIRCIAACRGAPWRENIVCTMTNLRRVLLFRRSISQVQPNWLDLRNGP
eukprot:SAG22_NODE_13175_length_416_cov_0.706625_1_plen_79_part_10